MYLTLHLLQVLTLLDIQMSPAVDDMLFSNRGNQVDRKAV